MKAVTVTGARVHVALEDMCVVNQLALSFPFGKEGENEVLFTVNELPAPGTGR